MSNSFQPVATIRSCYTQRFGIPRQAGLVPSATAQIIFDNTEHNRLSLRGLEEFSHLWVIFQFHQQHYETSKPLVQPPRLGGKKSMGVFATRSPNRPNPIGLSCVALEDIVTEKQHILLHISGGDFLNNTPVLDIKPYIAFADAIKNSSCAWASPVTADLPVQWKDSALQELNDLCSKDNLSADEFRQLTAETISLDPRPAYERHKDGKANQQWHMRLHDYDISFEVVNAAAVIARVRRCS